MHHKARNNAGLAFSTSRKKHMPINLAYTTYVSDWHLPEEIWQKVFSFLDMLHVLGIYQVCKHWNKLLHNATTQYETQFANYFVQQSREYVHVNKSWASMLNAAAPNQVAKQLDLNAMDIEGDEQDKLLADVFMPTDTQQQLLPDVQFSARQKLWIRLSCLKRAREALHHFVVYQLLNEDYTPRWNNKYETQFQEHRKKMQEFREFLNWNDLPAQSKQDILHACLKDAQEFATPRSKVQEYWSASCISYAGKLFGFYIEVKVRKSGPCEVVMEDVNWDKHENDDDDLLSLSFVADR